MEEAIEKVVEKYLRMFVELSECEKKKKELRNAFVQEFNIEPEVITPKEARRGFEIEDERVEVIDNVLETFDYKPADEDEYYIIVFTTKYNEGNEVSHDWTLITDYGLPYLQKATSQFVYKVFLEIWRYNDC